jgi:hypothetical protein
MKKYSPTLSVALLTFPEFCCKFQVVVQVQWFARQSYQQWIANFNSPVMTCPPCLM